MCTLPLSLCQRRNETGHSLDCEATGQKKIMNISNDIEAENKPFVIIHQAFGENNSMVDCLIQHLAVIHLLLSPE